LASYKGSSRHVGKAPTGGCQCVPRASAPAPHADTPRCSAGGNYRRAAALGRCRGSRLGRPSLQCTVHVLVTAIVPRAGRLDVARVDTELEPPKPTTPRARQHPSIRVALRCRSVSHMAGQPHQRSVPSRPSRRPTWGRQSVHPVASVSVSGSQRAPSAVRNLPLESIDHSSSGAV
jgi:hypothetical protein